MTKQTSKQLTIEGPQGTLNVDDGGEGGGVTDARRRRATVTFASPA